MGVSEFNITSINPNPLYISPPPDDNISCIGSRFSLFIFLSISLISNISAIILIVFCSFISPYINILLCVSLSNLLFKIFIIFYYKYKYKLR